MPHLDSPARTKQTHLVLGDANDVAVAAAAAANATLKPARGVARLAGTNEPRGAHGASPGAMRQNAAKLLLRSTGRT